MNYDDYKLATPPEGDDRYIIENQIDDYKKSQDKIANRINKIYDLIELAKKRIEKISVSEAIPYTVAGGYFERQNDILRYEYIISRLNESLDRNNKEWDNLESEIDELEYKLNNL
jgi:prefoldin subunit 5